MRSRRSFLATVVVLAAVLMTMTLRPASASAQGNSSIDQYIERVPDAQGGKPATGRDKGQGRAPGKDGGSSAAGGDSSSGDGPSGGSKKKKPSRNQRKDERKKDSGPAATGGGGESGGNGPAGTLALEHVPGGGASGDGGGSAPLVALIVLLCLGVAGAVAYWRLVWRRRDDAKA
jgi:hypothetical protein